MRTCDECGAPADHLAHGDECRIREAVVAERARITGIIDEHLARRYVSSRPGVAVAMSALIALREAVND